MLEKSLDFLGSLIAEPSPSGYEQPAQRVWREYMAPYADEVRTDLHGNCIAAKNPSGGPRILLAGHVDELGFMVKYVNDEGYLSFATVGGFDVGIIPGRRVRVHTKNGPIMGVIGKKAIHLMTPEDRKKIPDIHELWIDIGVKDKEEALSLVSIGDVATYAKSVIALALQGEAKVEVLFEGHRSLFPANDLAPAIRDIAEGGYRAKGRDEIKGSGYVVRSLEAALWCFWQTDSYQNAVLLAANLGDDADTTAAVCGQIAGAYYGVGSIPETWLVKLARRALIQDLARQLSVSYASRNIGMAGVQK